MTAIVDPDAEEVSGGRLQRRKARTRAAILAAASDLFQENGYEHTSIQQIAERADTGVGTLYGYFRSKEDVLREVLRQHSVEAVQHYRGTIDASTPAIERICTALRVLQVYFRENRVILRAAFSVGIREGESEGHPESWLYRAWRQMLQEGMDSGELRQLPVDTTVRSLLTVYSAAFLGVGQFRGRRDNPQVAEDLEAMTRALLLP